MTLVQEWQARAYQPQDEEAVTELLRLSLGEDSHGADPAVWRWKHVENVFGPSFTRLACGQDGRVIGLRAFMQWRLQVGGRTLRAVRAVDTATHPDFRRMGVFAGLTKGLVEDVRQAGVDLVFNTPNQFSLPGYLKMGWQLVGTVQPLLLVLDRVRFFPRLMGYQMRYIRPRAYSSQEYFSRPVPHVRDILDSAKGVRRLLARSSEVEQGAALATPLSWEYLKWRYAAHPHIPYYGFAVGDRDGPAACAIFRTNSRFGLKEVVLSEVLLSDRDEGLVRQLVRGLRQGLRADYLIAYSGEGSFLRRALRRCGFWPVPRWGMKLVARPLAPDLPVDPFRIENWALGLGDLELF